jgi:hypothetical protein
MIIHKNKAKTKGGSMKRAAMLLGVLAVGSALGWSQGTEINPDQSKPEMTKPETAKLDTTKTVAPKLVAALSWLVGGVWTADASKLGPGMQRIETRYQWSDNNAYIRFNTHFIFDNGTAKTYDGNFFWNPEQKSLAVWYMDSRNDITQGPVEINGDVTKIRFRGPDFEGKVADLQVFVTRKTNDDYRWSVQEKQGDTWKELAALEYLRVPGS